MDQYIIGIDQSTQGTKALLFNAQGRLIGRSDIPHRQIINDKGWVSHDPSEVYDNTVKVVKKLIEENNVDKSEVVGIGISNQRETSVAWDRDTGEPVDHAIVWQCSRAKDICAQVEANGVAGEVFSRTGIQLSPFFPASKFAWLIQNSPGAGELAEEGRLCLGTVDAYLVFRLTGGRCHKTDYSNASRTQLFNLKTLSWDEEICGWFGVPTEALPEVTDSNGDFGETDLEGYFTHPVPIRGVMGDSHGALFGQGCHERGMVKSTYGTGSSIMMNIGPDMISSSHGIVTSLAWGIDGKVTYVLEGNINYSAAVIAWLQKDVELIESPVETAALAKLAAPEDKTYLVPAFSGLGAPYWDNDATASFCGMTRNTGKKELVRAALDCIAYQINDILSAMKKDTGIGITHLRVDGGATKNDYLMQFQSDIADVQVDVPDAEELSGIGAAYMAGIALGVFDPAEVFSGMNYHSYTASMDEATRAAKCAGWKKAVDTVLTK